ncbi:MAG: prepilin-type N-terminal cleavage/methylation domain-containing protein [Chthoniobacteraceae bacterium]
MNIPRRPLVRGLRRAFTLIEVMIAVLIMMLLALSIYRFLSVNLEAIASASESVAEEDELTALFSYLQMELNNIPPRGQGLLIGTAYRFKGVSKDEMQWISGPGPGFSPKPPMANSRRRSCSRRAPRNPTYSILACGGVPLMAAMTT